MVKTIAVTVAKHDGFCLLSRIGRACFPFPSAYFMDNQEMSSFGAGIVYGLLACTAAIPVMLFLGIVGLIQCYCFVKIILAESDVRRRCDIKRKRQCLQHWIVLVNNLWILDKQEFSLVRCH